MSLLTPTGFEQLQALKPQDLFSVYSGRPGRCCCGCFGQHRYLSEHRVAAGKHRGYTVDDEDINDRQVNRVLRLLQANPEKVEAGER